MRAKLKKASLWLRRRLKRSDLDAASYKSKLVRHPTENHDTVTLHPNVDFRE